MTWVEAIVLGVVQGLTEFLPISSSGHLRITSAIFFEQDAGASFTAVTQLGTEAAVLLYFAKDIWRITRTWVIGIWDRSVRSSLDYRMGWYVIVGSIPIGVFGLLFKDQIRETARNLWLVASTLILFAFVLAFAEYWGRQTRTLENFRMRDGVVMGFAQAMALIPGVSRSGGTLTAGLLLNLTRETAARYSFLLAIPAVVMSGILSLEDVFAPAAPGTSVPSGAQMIVATVVAFAVGYAAIAWLLRYVAHHTLYIFVLYRVALGTLVLALLLTGTISAT
ncbi:undecaprenyl-diphosphate phosphatase [Salinispora arenicola]|uniref:Undecaprenyl-diphosphatase n=2 Tax=Salinispora arenicola TaxID=168697 RepID=A0A542XSI3_SALAC|nr:undecaprenyl-diphosphate phosphatase [Salinispora arenicola]MCN0152953.1 undecaprenyl-diphosphate phosphatase [Salinispora arenicola]NIL57422.1 undecaprenyl-diphosphate phosphatase [Salinispora arenicola]NIL62325.1 undecaprenyl-diphosphate phosphatase [Salinispora arenicola]TQL38810.1 undecaprenyl-diphosphatase [Salinispora arenicola]GIM85742.1 undecaprenyl-diphosphatase [Salinispora arenicola]